MALRSLPGAQAGGACRRQAAALHAAALRPAGGCSTSGSGGGGAGRRPGAAARPAKLRDGGLGNLSTDEKVERLKQLSEVGEVRSPFDTSIRTTRDSDTSGEPDLDVLAYEGDASQHNFLGFHLEEVPNSVPGVQVVAAQAFEEDEAIVQVPLHNCMVVYLWERVAEAESADADEREDAANELQELQLRFMQEWEGVHGEIPTELLRIVCDFSSSATSSHFKVAMWLLWVSERCSTSPYWSIILDALPTVDELPQPILCTEWELEQLQWPPMTTAALGRKHGLRDIYEGLIESGLASKFGFAEEESEDGHMLTFERFAWAYIVAHKRSFVYGDRLLFFPQVDPGMYTNDVNHINSVIGIVKVDDTSSELAVMAALRDVEEGELLGMYAPISSPGMAGTTSDDLFWAFGYVPPGNDNDVVDLEPEVGTELDYHLKTVMGQGANTSLDVVTDPRLRNLIDLVEKGQMPAEDLPPLREMLPALQIPKLWAPSLVAGLKSIRHVEGPVLQPGEGGQEGDTMVYRVPGDESLVKTAEGRAVWRRIQAAFASLPKASINNREEGAFMDKAVAGAPVAQTLPSRRDLEREASSAGALLQQLRAVVASFETSPEHDQGVLDAALSGADPISPGMHAVISWRLEFKLLWKAMADLVAEYKDALLLARA